MDIEIKKAFDDMDTKFTTQFAAMDTKFTAQFAAMDTKFSAQFAAMDAKFTAKFATMDLKLSAMDTKFTTMMHEAGLREEHRDDLLKAIYDVVIRQSVEREKVAHIETKVDDHEYRIRAVETIVTKSHD